MPFTDKNFRYRVKGDHLFVKAKEFDSNRPALFRFSGCPAGEELVSNAVTVFS